MKGKIFDLEELVNSYIYLLCPLIKVRKTVTIDGSPAVVQVWVRATEKYQNIIKICEQQSEVAKKHKKELFGTNTELIKPDAYTLMDICVKHNMTPSTFENLSVVDRAKIIAYYFLENMIEIIMRHDSIVEENEKKANNKK